LATPDENMLKTSTILLAEDHALVRQGLRTLLSLDPALTIVGETGDGAAVMGLLAALRPDLLLLDLDLPGRSGFDIVEALKRANDPVRILVLTGSLREVSVRRALAAGADGYIPKSDDTDELLVAINAVLAGRQYVSRRIASQFARHLQAAGLARAEPLTLRQREIVCLVASGRSNEEIAADLGISVFTVRTHRQHFMKKLHLRNAVEITAYAIQSGFYDPA
jgi:DNA-binding NarL/FixJ family response regulator